MGLSDIVKTTGEYVAFPFRIVDNQLDLIVHKAYTFCKNNWGVSQYSLSNFYAVGSFTYLAAASSVSYANLENTPAIGEELGLVMGVVAGAVHPTIIHVFNRIMKRNDDIAAEYGTSSDRRGNDIIRSVSKDIGRFLALYSVNAIINKFTGYSLLDVFGINDLENLEDLLGFIGPVLLTLSYYTSAIDPRNPTENILAKEPDPIPATIKE